MNTPNQVFNVRTAKAGQDWEIWVSEGSYRFTLSQVDDDDETTAVAHAASSMDAIELVRDEYCNDRTELKADLDDETWKAFEDWLDEWDAHMKEDKSENTLSPGE